ncbi:MAG: class II aldolase/adducin family protein [Bacteroidetes bacterium]|nr:class II aldolase/adducin family protein [Bacteroidota bacterium]MCL2302640.1 class II aldolase/adducin family protein [Lentimicrobiaceae bacterium]
MIFEEERKQVAQIMRRLYERGLTTTSGGNVSFKNADGHIFITASQSDKSCIDESKIVVLDKNFKNLTPKLKPSMETEMHIKIYENRPDISAIVHSHPVFASTFAVSDVKLDTFITEEAGYILGEIAVLEHRTMGSSELAKACSEGLMKHNVGLMKNHGAIAVGRNLIEAFDRIEVLEFTARIHFNCLMLKK